MAPTALQSSLELGLPTPITIKFHSTTRNNTRAEMIHHPSQTWEEIEKEYATLWRMDADVANWVVAIYPEVEARKELLRVAIYKCISKCESLYGYSVSDYDEHQADAILVIT